MNSSCERRAFRHSTIYTDFWLQPDRHVDAVRPNGPTEKMIRDVTDGFGDREREDGPAHFSRSIKVFRFKNNKKKMEKKTQPKNGDDVFLLVVVALYARLSLLPQVHGT